MSAEGGVEAGAQAGKNARREMVREMGRKSNFVVDAEEALAGMDGCMLTWHGFFGESENHDTLLLCADSSSDKHEPALLRLHRVEYIDCPMTMTQVHFAVGNTKALDLPPELRQRQRSGKDREEDEVFAFQDSFWPWALQCGLLSIECEQGIFFVLAGGLDIDLHIDEDESRILKNIRLFSWLASTVYETHMMRFDATVDIGIDPPLWFGGPTLSEL